MKLIKMSPDKRWSDLKVGEKAPFVIRGVLQLTLLVAALVETYRRPAE